MSLITSNKSGILSSVMRQGNDLGLMYQKHQLEKLDDNQSRMNITFEGNVIFNEDELINTIGSNAVVTSIEHISISESAKTNAIDSLSSGSRFTILRAGYLITPEAIKIAEDNLTLSLGHSAASILVRSAVTKTKHIGDLYLLLSKELRGKAKDNFLALVSDLKTD